MVNVIIFVAAVLALIGATDSPLGNAVSGFVLAGFIPGFDIQLPWYAGLLLVLLALCILAVLLAQTARSVISAQIAAARPRTAALPSKTQPRYLSHHAHTANRHAKILYDAVITKHRKAKASIIRRLNHESA